MSIFVVDNNIFSHSLRSLSLDVFTSDIYEPWSNGMKNGTIISVDEVYRELDKKWGQEASPDPITKKDKRTNEAKWIKNHKNAFLPLTNDEGKIVAEIFKHKKFREGVKEISLRAGSPEADAILVAKAKCIGGIIITAENNNKPNADKIPNICVALGVPYITRDDFYRILRNISKDNPMLDNVTVWHTLQIEKEDVLFE
ncbi:MAG: DUF4411 family protein [Defluviitaleaceae bacterium]|nr:DUF4411 family protein [Defluviitaleaceae bacterium]